MILFNSVVVLWLLTATVVHAGREHSYNDGRIKKTIQSSDGDIIDCFDIFRQPGLDHPLLKNHTIKMKPDKTAEELFRPKSKPVMPIQTWQLSGICPEGTVPIRRTSINATFHFPRFRLPISASSLGKEASDLRYDRAVVLSFQAPYHGASADIDVWDIHVEPNEFSLNYIGVEGDQSHDDIGDFSKAEIVAGWEVNPAYFGDSNPRTFIYYTSDGSKNVKCPNHDCGFIQTNQNIALGSTFTSRSIPGGQHYATSFNIHRDQADYKWWISIEYEAVGYYPGDLFDVFYDAKMTTRGGMVTNRMPGGKHTSTQMGSGHFPREGGKMAGWISNYLAINNDGDLFKDPPGDTKATHPGCYNIKNHGFGNQGDLPGFYSYYGGPGGPNCDQ